MQLLLSSCRLLVLSSLVFYTTVNADATRSPRCQSINAMKRTFIGGHVTSTFVSYPASIAFVKVSRGFLA